MLNAREQRIVNDAILRIENRCEDVAPEVQAALEVAGLYLRTWVTPALAAVGDPNRTAGDLKLAESMVRVNPARVRPVTY